MVFVIYAIVVLLLTLFALWGYVNVRARRLDQQVGAFRAWARLDSHSGWMSGIGQYQGAFDEASCCSPQARL